MPHIGVCWEQTVYRRSVFGENLLKQFQMLYFRYKSMFAWVTKLKSGQDSNNNTAQGKY